MAVAPNNCNITKLVREYSQRKSLGIKLTKFDSSELIQTYIAGNTCGIVHPCDEPLIGACDTEVIHNCTFSVNGMSISENATDITFNILSTGATTPVALVWDYDAALFDLKNGTTVNDTTLTLIWKHIPKPSNVISKISVACIDGTGCKSSKSCYFTKINNVVTVDCVSAPITCNAITGLTINNITDTSLQVGWNDDGLAYDIEFSDSTTTTTKYNTSSPYVFTGLVENTQYTTKVISHCPDKGTMNATVSASTILTPCTVPSVTVTFITNTSFIVNPVFVGGTVSISIDNGATYPYTISSGTQLFTGLNASTLYNVKVRHNCANTTTSTVSTTATTLASAPVCNPVTGLTITYGTYNPVSQTYPVTIAWLSIPGVFGYDISIDTGGGPNTITVTNGSSYTFDLPDNTAFTGDVQTICTFTSQSTSVNFSGTTPLSPVTSPPNTPTNIILTNNNTPTTKTPNYQFTVDNTVTQATIKFTDNPFDTTFVGPNVTTHTHNIVPGNYTVSGSALNGGGVSYTSKYNFVRIRIILTNGNSTITMDFLESVGINMSNFVYPLTRGGSNVAANINESVYIWTADTSLPTISTSALTSGSVNLTMGNIASSTLNGLCDYWDAGGGYGAQIGQQSYLATSPTQTFPMPSGNVIIFAEITSNSCSSPYTEKRAIPILVTIP